MGKKQNKYKVPLIVVCVAVAVILIGPSIMSLSTIPVTNYGQIELFDGGTFISSGSILNVQSGSILNAWLRNTDGQQHSPEELDWTVSLRRADNDAWVEDPIAEYTAQDGSMRWTFSLESCAQGTAGYRVFWFAMIGGGQTEVEVRGSSYSFTVVNTQASQYSNAVFVTEPSSVMNVDLGDVVYATWKVDYGGSFTATVTSNGATVMTESYDSSAGDTMVMYLIDSSIEESQSLILTVTPLADNPILVSDTVTVLVGNASTPTTTTETTPTTTTGTTPPVPPTLPVPPIPPIEDNMILYGGMAIVAALIIVLVLRRK